jgi:hypothetical protein
MALEQILVGAATDKGFQQIGRWVVQRNRNSIHKGVAGSNQRMDVMQTLRQVVRGSRLADQLRRTVFFVHI